MRQARLSIFRGCAALIGWLLLCGTSGALAQDSLGSNFGAFSSDSDEPINIESDVLEVYDGKKLAIFKGKVKAVQGKTTINSDELDVHYEGGSSVTGQAEGAASAAQPAQEAGKSGGGQSSDTQVTKIMARGDVHIITEPDQEATSEWALFDVAAQTVTIGGNVVLSQGDNVIKGDRLIIDLATGQSRFEHTATSENQPRIRGVFMPKSAKSDDQTSQPADIKPDVAGRAQLQTRRSGSETPGSAGTIEAPRGVEGNSGEDDIFGQDSPWQQLPQGE
jgi:lipopolysaccharide export system protein LptA